MRWSWARFAQVAQAIAPLALSAAGVPPELTNLVVHAVTVAEQSKDGVIKTGEQKKALAMSIVTDGLNAVNVVRPGTLDVPQLTDAVSGGIDTTIKAITAAQNIPIKDPSSTV